MAFYAKAIPPRLLKLNTIRGQILSALRVSEKEMKFALELTTATWNHPVTFESHIQYRGGDLVIVAWTKDYVWQLLNRGTSIRYATMTDDFQPKTKRGFLGSFRGQGGMAFVNKKRPRPGIKSRDWTIIAVRKYQKSFNARIGIAIFRGMRG